MYPKGCGGQSVLLQNYVTSFFTNDLKKYLTTWIWKNSYSDNIKTRSTNLPHTPILTNYLKS